MHYFLMKQSLILNSSLRKGLKYQQQMITHPILGTKKQTFSYFFTIRLRSRLTEVDKCFLILYPSPTAFIRTLYRNEPGISIGILKSDMHVLKATYIPNFVFAYLECFKIMFKMFSFRNISNLVLLKFLRKNIVITIANQKA